MLYFFEFGLLSYLQDYRLTEDRLMPFLVIIGSVVSFVNFSVIFALLLLLVFLCLVFTVRIIELLATNMT